MRLVEALTRAPMRAFDLDAHGVYEGSAAHITVVDPAARWTVDPRAFASRSRNTPFVGRAVQGRVVRTFVGGRCVFEAPAAAPSA